MTLMRKMQTATFTLLFLIAVAMPASAETAPEPAKAPAAVSEPQRLVLTIGNSQVVEIPFDVTRVSVGAPEIADVVALSTRQLYVMGKGLGSTNLLAQGKGQKTVIDIVVDADVNSLKEKLHTLLPKETIEVYPAKDGILLKGEVSSSPILATALTLAEPFAPKKVVNLMQVGGLQQVLLEVRVAEISRTALNELRFNYQSITKDFFLATNLGGALAIPFLNIPPTSITTQIAPSTNLIVGATSGRITGYIEAMKQDGLIKVLAEPNLMAVSGQEATFLAGGEFPVPIPQTGNNGVVTVEFKKFGVLLKFIPTVLDSGKISLAVAPEVSEVDFSTAVSVGGFVVPGVSSRSVSTTVELMDGHTFAIAGLIRDDARHLVSKYPILGDIPVLGTLFRSTSFQKNETELVILVSPHLVKSLGAIDTVSLPTDRYPEYERELQLLGTRSSSGAATSPAPRGGLEGEFGHSH